MRAWSVERANSDGLNAARGLLTKSGLPTDGLEETELWCVRNGATGVAGIAGLEVWGTQGLLRSVVVDGERRGTGLGRALVKHVIEEASAKGLTELYLITETAPGFFEKLGFRRCARKVVKGQVLRSVEFTSACPDTAPVMMLKLK